MKLISRWRQKIEAQHDADIALEERHRIVRSEPKNWVSPADIEALEEAMVPWLRAKRRRRR